MPARFAMPGGARGVKAVLGELGDSGREHLLAALVGGLALGGGGHGGSS